MRLIDAEAFLKTEIDRCGSAPLVGTCTSDNEYLSDRLKKAPTIEAKHVVHGHFIHDGPRFTGGVDWWHCSNCGKLASGVEILFNYCPWCGVKMDKRRTCND